MAIDVKLSKKIKGDELIEIIKDSMESLEDYKIKIEGEGYYDPDLKQRKDQTTHIIAEKNEIKRNMTFKNFGRMFYTIPVFGWFFYLIDYTCTWNENTKITASIEHDKEYDKVKFWIDKENTAFTTRNLDSNLDIKEDFESLVDNLYSRFDKED